MVKLASIKMGYGMLAKNIPRILLKAEFNGLHPKSTSMSEMNIG